MSYNVSTIKKQQPKNIDLLLWLCCLIGFIADTDIGKIKTISMFGRKKVQTVFYGHFLCLIHVFNSMTCIYDLCDLIGILNILANTF